MIAKVKIGFKGLSIPLKIAKAETIQSKMTGNKYYPNPNPTMEVLGVATTALHDAYQDAADGGSTKKAIMYQRESELDDLITLEAAYVQTASGGVAEIILTSGFEVVGDRSASVLPEQPQQLVAETSGYAGQILLSWKAIKNANSYMVEKSMDGNTGWEVCGKSTKANIAINNLPPLSYVWFRVLATGAAGDSPFSAAVKGLVA